MLKRFITYAFFFTFCLTAAEDPKPATKAGVYVAVGYGGRRMSSRDGVTWENIQQWMEKGGDDSNNLISVAYGKGKFVAVGGGGWTRETQAGHILVSPDGKEWKEAAKLPNRVSPITFGNDRFVVGAPDKQLQFSEDGENWKPGAKISYEGWAFWFRHGAFGNGVFLFAGNAAKDQKTHWAATSKDGTSIDSFQTDLPPVRALAFGAGRFVLVGPDGLRISSSDGKKWENQQNAPGEDLWNVIWNGREFLATGKAAYKSPDGITWTKIESKIPCGVIYGDDHIYIGTTWPGQMWSSIDGVAWKKGAPLSPNGINQIVFGEVLSK